MLRLTVQTVFLFFMTIAMSGVGALVQVNFLGGFFLASKPIKYILVGVVFVLLLYVYFRYCFPDQIAQLRGRNVQNDRNPVWVKQYILFNCALFVEEVFYYTIKEMADLSEVIDRLLGFAVFISFYVYMMSGEDFKIKR